jgi:hypothetical protein
MSKENIQNEITLSLKKYEGMIVKDVLPQIRKDLQDVMNNFVSSEEDIYKQDFPIEFENDLGEWKIMENGDCFVSPKMGVEWVEITINIQKTNE